MESEAGGFVEPGHGLGPFVEQQALHPALLDIATGFALPLEQHGGKVFQEASRFALESNASPLRALFRPEALATLAVELTKSGEGRDPEDSPFRRVHRRWLLTLLARTLERHPGAV